MRTIVVAALVLSACKQEPKPPPVQYVAVAQPQPVQMAPAAMPVGPVAPGNYTNHIGNPQAGYWNQQGQWQWHDPNSKQASSTMGYLAAAGAGAAGGALLSHYFTKRHFQEQNPQGWRPQERAVTTYMDRRGNPISEAEYRRRREQSERDRRRHLEQKVAAPQQQYRDKNGRFISKQEYDRRQQQSARDRTQFKKAAPKPKPKKLNVNRWNKKRRK